MATPETDAIRRRLFGSLDRLLKSLDGLDRGTASARLLENANSLFALGMHTLGTVEWMILGRACEQPITRDRATEFAQEGDPAAILARADAVKSRVAAALDTLAPNDLEATRSTPTGTQTVRDVLLNAVAHTAEHAGHAELTRDLLRAKSEGGR